MRVYFSGSRYYRDEFSEVYEKIISVLKQNDCIVADNTTKSFKGAPKWGTDKERSDHYRDMVKMMDRADFSVFEASFPSTLHVGHEITLALDKGKPVIVMYRDEPSREPMLFRGINNDRMIWVAYTIDNLVEKLTGAVESAKKIQDVRFNFFVSPKILAYLDSVAQKRMIPRSVFLRNLIEREMKKSKDLK